MPQQDQITVEATTINENEANISAPNKPSNPDPKRRTGRRDRHSKIHTARGMRDRRMRLSVQIARKFFDLQDMLGFDKASKTVEWLFAKSKSAIKELTKNIPKLDSCSGEVHVEEAKSLQGVVPCEKKSRKDRKVAFGPEMKESRDRARARARERTREKLIIKSLDKPNLEANPRTADENFLDHQFGAAGNLQNFTGNADSLASNSIFGFQNNSLVVSDGEDSNIDLLGGLGNCWETESARMFNYCTRANMGWETGKIVDEQNSTSTTSNHLESLFLGN
ncbi:hypothetical protein NMG60_11009494 [Bertholletia excelsa]